VDLVVVAGATVDDIHYDHCDLHAVYHDLGRAHLAQSGVHCLQDLHWGRKHHTLDSPDGSGLVEIYAQEIVDDNLAIDYGLAFYCRSGHRGWLDHHCVQ
jgi:hypothetical protein